MSHEEQLPSGDASLDEPTDVAPDSPAEEPRPRATNRKPRRLVPSRLSEKLRRIRHHCGLSQGEMLQAINPYETTQYNRARVSQYETGARVPSLIEIVNYALLANVLIEVLLYDDLELPFD